MLKKKRTTVKKTCKSSVRKKSGGWHGQQKEKYYYVEWSAPIIRNSGRMTVMALNKSSAIAKVKAKLGSRVKSQNLHHFSAF